MFLDKHHQAEIGFVALFMILALCQVADASFYCDGWLECSNSAYKGCCFTYAGDIIPVCVPQSYDCSEHCCIGGGCDSWNDFWFCEEGRIANCDTTSSNEYGMVCCSEDYPVYSDVADACWKSDWECTNNDHCDGDEACVNHKCSQIECDDNFKVCDGNYVVIKGYDAINHGCVQKEISRTECDEDETCSGGQCVGFTCDDSYWTCDGFTRVEKGYFPEDHECILKDTGNEIECLNNQICADGECVDIVCDDNDNCTTDTIINHECSHTFNDADSDGVCDADDVCPTTYGTGIDGCPYDGDIIDIIIKEYGIYIIMIGGFLAVLLIIIVYIMVSRRRKPMPIPRNYGRY